MADPKLIATLIPSDLLSLAANAFCHKHNCGRYLAPRHIEEGPALSSREATPVSGELIVDKSGKYDYTHRLTLNLNRKMKDPAKGFCFGSNPNICDIVLGPRRQGISNLHFCITFVMRDGKVRLILKDVSTCGTAVAYSGQARDEVRNHFVWILDLVKEEGRWELEVYVRKIRFIVKLANHETCVTEYKKAVEEFVQEESTLSELALYTPTEPASPAPGPRFPIYIRERELGQGSFESVDKVINVSTGDIYARKNFFNPQWERSETRRAQQREEWLAQVHREIRIMKENQHRNITAVVDYQEDFPPFIIMPYFAFENLHDQHSKRTLSELEAIDVLYQVLNALQYLHARGVAHRDLKPENILVASRTSLSVKLADFGLANDKSYLETICGTQLYVAPEVYRRSRYTTAVDLWSLGVIILDYVYGLPSTNLQISRHQHKEWRLAWCRRVADHANDFDSDALMDLLTVGMLDMTPKKQLSAGACLINGHNSGLFGELALGSGNAIPRPKSAVKGDTSDGAGSTMIILDALWSMEDEISNRGKDSGTGCFPAKLPSHTSEPHTHKSTTSPSGSCHGDPKLKYFKTEYVPSGHGGQSLVDLPSSPKVWSTCVQSSKRLRSPAVGSANNSSDRRQIKRRPGEDHTVEIPVKDTGEIQTST